MVLTFTFFLYFSLEKGASDLKIEYDADPRVRVHTPPIIFEGKRFVHLDLKGAPPNITYYKNLFPFFSKLGANGILIEYEDMFPYTGEMLEQVPAHNAYTPADIDMINLLAEENNLTVIPLIQTFGHLEFFLKLKRFSPLREVPKYPQVICPLHNATLSVLHEMIMQIIRAHPKSTMIHIGADEVYHIGKCDRCKQYMFEEKISTRQLFLAHVKRVGSHIKIKHPNIRILMWDDEFRSIDEEELRLSGISALVEPVVWKYTADVYSDLGYDIFNKYARVFKKIWIASAFKGATGADQYLTPIFHHVSNHQSWLKVYRDFKERISIEGIFLTGWQRYDHFATLCELLPIGIPSLVFNFAVLSGYNKNSDLYDFPKIITDLLKCNGYYALTSPDHGTPYCQYPGGNILDSVVAFHQFKLRYENFKRQSTVLGWMSDYNNNHNFSNPYIVNQVLEDLTNYLSDITTIQTYFTETMLNVYDKYTVSEWQETFLKPVYNDIVRMMDLAKRLLVIDDWPRRPL